MPLVLEPQRLLVGPDPTEILGAIRKFVRDRCLVSRDDDWREVEHQFADEHAFLDFSAWRDRRKTRLLIEFGVRHLAQRRMVGFFEADWDFEGADFGQLVAVSLFGQPAGLDEMAVQLPGYLMLPLTSSETL